MSACVLVVSLNRADKLLYVVRYAVVGRAHGDMYHTYNNVRHSLRRTTTCTSIIRTFVDFSGAVLPERNADVLLNQSCLSWYIIGRQNVGSCVLLLQKRCVLCVSLLASLISQDFISVASRFRINCSETYEQIIVCTWAEKCGTTYFRRKHITRWSLGPK